MTEFRRPRVDAPEGQDRLSTIEAQIALISRVLANAAPSAVEAPVRDNWPDPSPTSFARGRARVVREAIRVRRKRDAHFADYLFADPAWDMLLDLYAAHYEEKKVSISSLCIAAAVPATTGLRWIKSMEDEGHFQRSHDPADGRRVFIRISDDARARMDDYFDEIGD